MSWTASASLLEHVGQNVHVWHGKDNRADNAASIAMQRQRDERDFVHEWENNRDEILVKDDDGVEVEERSIFERGADGSEVADGAC
jgi:hypothetical protein